MNIRETGQKLAGIISKLDAEYVEVHLEESQSSHLTYRGKELESSDKTNAIGGNVRALVKGGWGFVSFNSLDKLAEKAKLAVEQAALIGGGDSKIKSYKAIVDKVTGEVKQNPVEIPLSQKKEVLDEYNQVIWETPKLRTSSIGYSDGYRVISTSTPKAVSSSRKERTSLCALRPSPLKAAKFNKLA